MNNPPVLRLTDQDYILLIKAIDNGIQSINEWIQIISCWNVSSYEEKNSAQLFGDMMRLIDMKNAMRAMVEPIKLAQHGLQ